MKRYISIIVAMLAMFSVLPVSAQQTQDALYIFRNDGQFNAFFFGDIDRIEYSKIDTLGVEQADYVVQEIWALDTVCRIPISAIDSVAFVTPENKIRADVFCPDKSIANYIVASDTINWIRLASNTPTAMIPKVGDKLLIEEESKYIPDGFVGLVTSVENGNNGYTIMTGALSMRDVYDRLVIKAAAATPLQSGQTRRRGLIDGTEMSYTTEDPIELPAVSGSISIQGSRVLYDEHDVSLTADGAGSFGFSVAPRIEYRGFVFFDFEYGLEQDHTITLYNKASWNFSLTGSLTGNVDIPLKGMPEKSLSGGLKLAVNCGLFVNAQVTGLTVQAGWEGEYIGKSFLTHKVAPPFIFQESEPVSKGNLTVLKDTTTISGSTQGKYAFSAGVYAKAEVSAKLPFDKDNNVIKDKVGARVEAGGRLNFEAPFWTADVITDLASTRSIYQLLNKDTNISATLYGKLSLYAQIDDWVWSVNPELSLPPAHLYGIVPDISDIRASYDDPERPYRHKFTSPIRRDVLLGIPTGFVVFDQNDKVIDDWGGGYHFREKQGQTYDHVFTTLDPIKDDNKIYTVYPYIKYLGAQLLVDKNTDVSVDPARIDIEERELHVGSERGNKDIGVQPNMANVVCTPQAPWLTCVWLDHKNLLSVFWEELPDGVKERRTKILIEGKTSKTNELIIEDSIVVNQWVAYADVTPSKMDFEVEGGTQTATITATNISEYKVVTDLPWVHPTLKDNVITVTVDENKEADARGSSNAVILEGKKPDGESISMPIIYVEQAGTGETPSQTFVERVGMMGGYRYPEVDLTGYEEIKATSNQQFITASYFARLSIQISENTEEQERTGKVIVTGKNSTTGVTETIATITIIQDPKTDTEIAIKYVNLKFEINRISDNSKDPYRFGFAHWGDQDDVKVVNMVKEGNVMHVSGSGQRDYCSDDACNYHYVRNATFSFDIMNWDKIEEGGATITNLKFDRTMIDYIPATVKTNVSQVAANNIINIKKYDDKWKQTTNDKKDFEPYRTIEWSDTEGNGVSITNYFYSDKEDVTYSNGDGRHTYQEYSYYPSPDNMVGVEIRLIRRPVSTQSQNNK